MSVWPGWIPARDRASPVMRRDDGPAVQDAHVDRDAGFTGQRVVARGHRREDDEVGLPQPRDIVVDDLARRGRVAARSTSGRSSLRTASSPRRRTTGRKTCRARSARRRRSWRGARVPVARLARRGVASAPSASDTRRAAGRRPTPRRPAPDGPQWAARCEAPGAERRRHSPLMKALIAGGRSNAPGPTGVVDAGVDLSRPARAQHAHHDRRRLFQIAEGL